LDRSAVLVWASMGATAVLRLDLCGCRTRHADYRCCRRLRPSSSPSRLVLVLGRSVRGNRILGLLLSSADDGVKALPPEHARWRIRRTRIQPHLATGSEPSCVDHVIERTMLWSRLRLTCELGLRLVVPRGPKLPPFGKIQTISVVEHARLICRNGCALSVTITAGVIAVPRLRFPQEASLEKPSPYDAE
jgi:hypothetical protein